MKVVSSLPFSLFLLFVFNVLPSLCDKDNTTTNDTDSLVPKPDNSLDSLEGIARRYNSTVQDYPRTCLKQVGGSCKKHEDCADFNGHRMNCTKKRCTCSDKDECGYSPDNSTQALYQNCSDTLPCVAGHGFYPGIKHACAEPIVCLHSTRPGDNYAQCLTCEACIQQSINRFDCLSICPPKRIQTYLKEVEKNKTEVEEQAEQAEKDRTEKNAEDDVQSGASSASAHLLVLLSTAAMLLMSMK